MRDDLLQSADLVAIVASALDRGLFGIEGGGSDADLETIHGILEGSDRTHTAAVADLLRDNPEYLPDLVTAHLVAGIGIDPAAACAMGLLNRSGMYIGNGGAGVSTSPWGPVSNGAGPVDIVNLAGGTVQWLPMRGDVTLGCGTSIPGGSGYLVLPTLPETLLVTLRGRQLDAILSHPALDRLDLEIEAALSTAAPFGKGRVTHVHARSPAIGLDALLAIHPDVAGR